MNITGFFHININCSDYERSRAFYERLGFRVVFEIPADEQGPEIGQALGLGARPFSVRGALMALGDESIVMDLLEWQDPRDTEGRPYPHLYHLGIVRFAFRTTDLDADVATLRANGVDLLSDPVAVPGMAGTRYVCFKDPDGTILELVESAEG